MLNQFAQSDSLGRLDLHGNPNTFQAIVDESYTGDGLEPGQAVKIVASTEGVAKVAPVAALSDALYGFVSYDTVHPRFKAGRPVNIARTSNVLTLMSTGAIEQGTSVKLAVATLGGVAQSLGPADFPIGHAVDGASASGELIRVYINLPEFGLRKDAGKGVLDQTAPQNLMLVQLATGQSNVAVGSAVEGVDGTQAVPNVSVVNNNADSVLGFVVDAGQGASGAGDFVLIAQDGSTMYLTATAAFNRFTRVVVDQANAGNVTASTTGRTIVGWAVDKATANALVRIRIQTPSFATA